MRDFMNNAVSLGDTEFNFWKYFLAKALNYTFFM